MWSPCACRPCGTLRGARDVCTPVVAGNGQLSWVRTQGPHPRHWILNPRWLTTELRAPVAGWGGPSDPSQELLRVSLSGVDWESNPW